eukprot:7377425-Prymnesium_polylepis.1
MALTANGQRSMSCTIRSGVGAYSQVRRKEEESSEGVPILKRRSSPGARLAVAMTFCLLVSLRSENRLLSSGISS